ncbi:MAG: PD-(D/E)XK nuclease family protein, partial [Hyphomicrobiales bacterium]|nr:PD-(D/E)XK nuclease family protein [Hyphomicrobiales bacterium]
EAMIRALKERGVKVAGADRLMLREHIAVMDLLAAGEAALSPGDDLTLACVLKSPLIGLDDDELFALAAKRPGSLGAALAASENPRAAEAARRLAKWRGRAKSLSPYAFYARILGEDCGRKALLGRLGPDAADPIDEFLALALAHERAQAPSLHRFLAEVAATETPVKRDMEGESEGVRVLTVHASKGLEAPIVFLPDTCGAPDGRHDPGLLRLRPSRTDGPPFFAWSRRAAEDCEALAEARADARAAEAREHRRLLYVAMTRAGQRLIIAGYESARGRARDCWHDLVSHGLMESMAAVPAPWDGGETIFRMGEPFANEFDEPASAPPVAPALPEWLFDKAPQEAAARPLRPSQARSPRHGGRARALEGELAHALLQMLPGLAPAERREAARTYLRSRSAGLAEQAIDALVAQTVAVVEAPHLAALFGPGSQGEVALAGVVKGPHGADIAVNGRLDRMLVADACVTVVDFKLGARPARPLDAHVAQLALYCAVLRPLYPSRTIRSALVYLEGPTLEPIAEKMLEAALEAVAAA